MSMVSNSTNVPSSGGGGASDYLFDIQEYVGISYISVYASALIFTALYASYVEWKESKTPANKNTTTNTTTRSTFTLTTEANVYDAIVLSASPSPTKASTNKQDFDNDVAVVNTTSHTGNNHAIENSKQITSQETGVEMIDNKDESKLQHIWQILKQLLKRTNKYKSIYLTVIVHLTDVVTDYLVLCQYIVFAIDETNNVKKFDNIDYFWVSVSAAFTIIANKILSSYFVYRFTRSWFDVLLNVGDFYIFKEIIASHQSGLVVLVVFLSSFGCLR